jgi:hypothetical protein
MQILEFCCNSGEEENFLQQTIFSQIAIPTTQIQNHPMIIIKSDFLRASSGREKKQGRKQTNKQTNRDSCNSHNFCMPFASAQKEETTWEELVHKLGITIFAPTWPNVWETSGVLYMYAYADGWACSIEVHACREENTIQ